MEMARSQTIPVAPKSPDTQPKDPLTESEVGRIRRFNRFYTQRIGVLDGLGTEIPLSQTRLLFEIEAQEAPASVEMEIVETAPAMKGASQSARTKTAKLSSGLEIQVPEYLAEGERVKVNTATREFMSRA